MAEIKLKIASVVIGSGEGGGSGVAPYYADLPDKPSINGETLSGDMSSEDLGLASARQSVPSGGTTGQVLAKKSNADNDVQWVNQESGGTEVVANPSGQATTPLNKIKIGEKNYSIPQTDTSNLATKQELQQGLSGKQDTISDLQEIRTRADEGHTALQPIQDATPNNFVIFDENGGIKDSGKKDTDFATAAQGTKADNAIPMPTGTDGQILEKDSTSAGGVKWVNKPSDGKSAYQLYVDGGGTLTQEQWLASLKANIGEFLFVPTDAAAVTAMATIGQTYSSAIDPLGKNVAPSQNTLSVILLMNDDATTPTKTMMIATQDDGSSGFEFIYAGDLQSAMSSNVLTDDKIDNDFAGGSDKVAGAKEVKELADVTTILLEGVNILNPVTIKPGYMVKSTGKEREVPSTLIDWIYGCTDYIKLTDEGLVLNHGVANKHDSSVDFCACLYSDNEGTVCEGTHILYASEQGGALVIDKENYPTCNYVRFNLPVLQDDNTDFAVYRGLTLPEDDFVPYFIEIKQKSINSLDSDDEYTPLSAKQGKVLKQMINAPTSKVEGSVKTYDTNQKLLKVIFGNNRCNPDDIVYISGSYIERNTGVFYESGSSNTNGCTGFIPVSQKGLYCNKARASSASASIATGWAAYKLATQEEIDDNAITKFTVDGVKYVFSHGSSYGSAGKVYNYVSGDVYVRFTLSDTTDVMVNEGSEMEYEPYSYSYMFNDNMISERTVTVDNIEPTEWKYLGNNLCNIDECTFTDRHYIKGTNGSIGTNSNTSKGYTGFIPIDERGLYFNHSFVSGVQIGYAYYTSNNEGSFLIGRYVDSPTNPVGGTNNFAVYVEGAKYVRFSFDADSTSENVMVNVGSVAMEYEPYAGRTKVISKKILPDFATDSGEEPIEKPTMIDGVEVVLPNEIVITKSDRLQIFYRDIITSFNPYNFEVVCVCSVGTPYPRYFEYKPDSSITTPKSYALTISVYDNAHRLISSGSTYIRIVADATSPSANKNIMLIGASTLAAGEIVNELNRRFNTKTGTYLYASPFVVANGTTIKAIAYRSGLVSNIATLQYNGSAAEISSESEEGKIRVTISVESNGTVTIASSYPSATKYNYTIDGSDPVSENTGIFINPGGLGLTNISFVGRTFTPVAGVNQEAQSGWQWKDYATVGRYAYRFFVVGQVGINIEPGAVYSGAGTLKFTVSDSDIDIDRITGNGYFTCTHEGSGTQPSSGTLTLYSGEGDTTITYDSFNIDSGNPFWDDTNSQLDFTTYINTYCGGQLDFVVSYLGINDIFQTRTPYETRETYIKPFLRALHTQSPNTKVIICNLHIPSPYGGMGTSYGASSSTYWIKCAKYFDYIKALNELETDEEFSGWVSICSSFQEFDGENLYPESTTRTMCNRSEKIGNVQTNGVHPTVSGKKAIADSIFHKITQKLQEP